MSINNQFVRKILILYIIYICLKLYASLYDRCCFGFIIAAKSIFRLFSSPSIFRYSIPISIISYSSKSPNTDVSPTMLIPYYLLPIFVTLGKYLLITFCSIIGSVERTLSVNFSMGWQIWLFYLIDLRLMGLYMSPNILEIL